MTKENKKTECKCGENCTCGEDCQCGKHPHGFLGGFNFGFGFWTAGLLVATIVALISILIWWLPSLV